MKKKLFIPIFILLLGVGSNAQNLINNHWVFGKNQWNFNLSSTGNITRTNISFTGIDRFRYQSSSISNPSTGEFMFVTDGFNVYNKNLALMDNGGNLFNIPNSPNGARLAAINYYGNKTGQGSLIIPHPGNSNLYYIFSLSKAYRYNDDQNIPMGLVDVPGYGLSYSIVDMSQNSGLGKVVSRNNPLFDESHGTQGMTSTMASDGVSYWIITYKGNQFVSYKINNLGLNTTPVVSTTPYTHVVGDFLKISPNGQHIFVRHNPTEKAMLYQFNATTGSVSNGVNILDEADASYQDYYYMDQSIVRLNSAEFSPDSNIIYFIGAEVCSCLYPYSYIGDARLIGYNIDTNEILEFEDNDDLITSGSLQRGENGKIYVSQFNSLHNDGFNYYHTTINGWRVINNPNTWGNTNPLSTITNSPIMYGMSFPQLIPSPPPCPTNLYITNPITTNSDFQVSNQITASSVVYQNLTVNFKANQILLKPGFSVSAYERGVFKAIINPCSNGGKMEKGNRSWDEFTRQENKILPTLSPNPTSTFLNIDNIEEIYEWKLMDINGKIVDSGRVNNSVQTKITINTSRLISGIYYFNAVMKDGELFQKTVIKK